MKTLLILLLSVASSFAADPWKLAMDRSTEGWGKPNKCETYARALHAKMKAAGFKSHILVYVTEPIVEESPFEGFPMVHTGFKGHAVCVYYGPGKEVWAMDNTLLRPKMIRDGTPTQIARQFTAGDRVPTRAYFKDLGTPSHKFLLTGKN